MRELTSGFIAAATAYHCRPIFLFEGVFVGFTLRLWSGHGDLSWNATTFLGNGWLQTIESVEESDDLGSTGMQITLAGVPQSMISTVLGNSQLGAPGKLWLAYLDDSLSIIPDPYLIFDGQMDVPTIDDQVENPVIQISYESVLVDLDEAVNYRYTSETQKLFFNDDRGFDWVGRLSTGWTHQWGITKKESEKDQANLPYAPKKQKKGTP